MAGIGLHGDGETGVGCNLERLACSMSLALLRAVENNLTGPLDDLHAFGFTCSEMKGTGEDDPDGLVLTLHGDDGVRDDLPLEVDIGLGVNGCISEFHNALIGFR